MRAVAVLPRCTPDVDHAEPVVVTKHALVGLVTLELGSAAGEAGARGDQRLGGDSAV